VVLIAVAILPALRRGYKFSVPGPSQSEPAADTAVFNARTAPVQAIGVQGNGFAAGPRQVPLELKAWNSPVRPSALPLSKIGGAFNRLKEAKSNPSRVPAPVDPQPEESGPVAEPFFEAVGAVVSTPEPRHEESALSAEPFFDSVGPVVA